MSTIDSNTLPVVNQQPDILKVSEPPTCNTGVTIAQSRSFLPQLIIEKYDEKKSKVTCRIDWLAVTFPASVAVVNPPELSTDFVECKAFYGYDIGTKYSDGRVMLSHSKRKDMGTYIQCSSTALCLMSIEPLELMRFWVAAGAKVRRVDVACDAYEYALLPSTANKLISQGLCNTAAKKFPIWSDPLNPGITQYIGTKSSTVYTRIYDKSAEMGVSGDWVRVETVFQSDKAHGAALELIKGVSIQSLILGHVDFVGWYEWGQVMQAEPVKIKVGRKDTETMLWLLKAAAPSLAREVHLCGDHEPYFKFIEAFKWALSDLQSPGDVKF